MSNILHQGLVQSRSRRVIGTEPAPACVCVCVCVSPSWISTVCHYVKLGTWLSSIRESKNLGTEKLVHWRQSSPASAVKASAKTVQKCRTSPTHNSMLVKVGWNLLTLRRTAWYPADVQQIIAKQSRLGLTNPNLIKGFSSVDLSCENENQWYL